MAYGSQKAAVCGVMLLAWAAGAAELRFDVRHDHWRKSKPGVLAADEKGLRYEEAEGDHKWQWDWQDVQQINIEPQRVRVLTYSDNPWKLGADREHVFLASGDKPFTPLYELLREKLDSRLVAVLPYAPGDVEWQIPVKLRQKFGGSEGTVLVGPDRIVYRSTEKASSRTWRFEDIDNISSSGPYDLTIVTFERSKGSYGDRRAFDFQLKQRLDEQKYNALWRRLNQTIQEKQIK